VAGEATFSGGSLGMATGSGLLRKCLGVIGEY
jgi:hypothetical protein